MSLKADHPVLSIFMPAYNAETYLAETLQSLLSQSFRNFELIIVDDGSSDNTVPVAQTFVQRDSRLRLVRSPHRGEVAARNKALSLCNPASRFFLNHDSDDISVPGKLESQIAFLEANPGIAVVGTLAEYFNDAGEHLGNPGIEVAPEKIRTTFHERNSVIHSAGMIRREVFETIGGYREEMRSVDDYDFFMRALLAGFSIANIPQVLHRIRLHPRSVGSTRGMEQQRLSKEIQAIYCSHRAAGPKVIASPLPLSKFYKPRVTATRRPLRILHTVQMYHPHVGGSEEVVKQLSERLVRRGHQVTVATRFHPDRNFTNWNGVEVRQFKVLGNAVHGIQGEAAEYQRFLLDNRFDVIVNYAAQIWSSDLMFPLLDRVSAAKVFVPCGYSGLFQPAFANYFRALAPVLEKYDRVVHLSGNYRDAQFSRRHNLKNSVIIGNAASEEEFLAPCEAFRTRFGIDTPYLIITVANHYPGKGHNHLLRWFRSMNRRDVTLAIIGEKADGGCWDQCSRDAASLSNVRLFHGLPRRDVISAFRDADLFWFGSEVECFPLVILEAMAAGTPWLSSDAGNVAELGGGWVSPDDQMVAKANTLLDSRAVRNQLAQEGQKQWRSRYTWQHIVDQYEQLYSSLADASGRRSAVPSKRSEPRVSVVIPCFNQAQYLPDAVESVVQQTYRNFEIIIVDDGSPDNTKQVAESLIEKHSNVSIRLLSHANRGLAASRNAGIEAAEGTFILPLDSDDKLKPEFLKRCVETVLKETGPAIVAVQLEEFGDSNRKLCCGSPILERIAIENQINYCSLFPKSLWAQTGGYRSNMRWGYEDWDFWISCIENGAHVVVVPEHLFMYRKRGTSMYTAALDHAAELQAQIALNHPGLYDANTRAWARAVLRLTRNASDADASQTVARYCASRDRWQEAIPHLTALTGRPDASGELVFLLGVAQLRTKQFAGGRRTLRRFLDSQPDHPVAHFLSALACSAAGDFSSARNHCEDALELNSKMTEAFELLIAICGAQRDSHAVKDLTDRAHELRIEPAGWPLSGSILETQSAPVWAEFLYTKYLRFAPLPFLQIESKAAAQNSATAARPSTKPSGPAVSVIMPTYNRPDRLIAAIESVLNQTFQDFEIIVVNDAGNDVESSIRKLNASGKISYARHAGNRGLAAARNTGLKLAQGRYIAYLDDDDVFYPDHLQTLVHCLENNDCAVAYTDANRAHEAVRDGRLRVTHKDVPFSCDFDHDRILVGNFIPVLCVMHRRDCLDRSGLFDESLTTHEDWDLWIRMSRHYRFGHIRKVTCEFSWRTDGTSMTSSKQIDFLRTLEIIYEKGREYSAGKPHVIQAQAQYLRNKRESIRGPQAGTLVPAAEPRLAALMERVERYVLQGKMDLARKILRKELSGIQPGAGSPQQQQQLMALCKVIGTPADGVPQPMQG